MDSNIRSIDFHRNHKLYTELCNKIEKLDIEIKNLEIEKLVKERDRLEAEMQLRELENEIVKYTLKL